MGDGIGTGLVRDLAEAFGDERPCDRGAEEIFPFVEGIGAKHRKHEVAHEFLLEIVDVDLFDAEHPGLGAGRLQLLALADVGREGHDLAVVGLGEPFQDHRGIQAAGIG